MNLDNLTPAPWEPSYAYGDSTKEILGVAHPRPDLAEKFPPDRYGPVMRREIICLAPSGFMNHDDAVFICLARNAFDGDPEALAWWETNRKRLEEK